MGVQPDKPLGGFHLSKTPSSFLGDPSPKLIANWIFGQDTKLLPVLPGFDRFPIRRMLDQVEESFSIGEGNWSRQPPLQTPRSLYEKHKATFSGGATDKESDFVVSFSNDDCAYIAIVFAVYFQRTWKSIDCWNELEALAGRVNSVTVILGNWALPSYGGFGKIIAKFAESGTKLGVVTGRTNSSLWAWLLKRSLASSLYRDYSHHVNLYSSEPGELSAVLGGETTRVSTIEGIRSRALIIDCHSKETCGSAGQKILCAKPEDENLIKIKYNTPSCARAECLWRKPILNVSSIQAQHVTSLSCGSLRLGNGIIDPNYSLGYGWIDGYVTSYVSPIRGFPAPKHLPHISSSLLSSHISATLGDYWLALNNVLSLDFEIPCIALLGDPLEETPVCNKSNSLRSVEDVMKYKQKSSISASPIIIQTEKKAKNENPLDTKKLPDVRDSIPEQLLYIKQIDEKIGWWPRESYGGHEKGNAFENWKQICPHCQSETFQYLNGGIALEARRSLVICSRCGIIHEGPSNFLSPDFLRIPNEVHRGIQFTISINLAGVYRDHPVNYILSVSQSASLQLSYVTCVKEDRFTSEGREISVQCMITEGPSFVHLLKVWIVVGERRVFSCRPIMLINDHEENQMTVEDLAEREPLIGI